MRPFAAPAVLLALSSALLSSGLGCAASTPVAYAIVAPAEASGPVPRDVGSHFRQGEVEYEVYQSRDKVVLRFVNRTAGPLRLTDASTMTDARGRRFAVEPQTVVPDGAGRLIVPPGLAIDRDDARRPIAGEVRIGGIDEPGLLRARDDSTARPAAADPTRFHWPAGSLASFMLRFTTPTGTTLDHEWVIRRE